MNADSSIRAGIQKKHEQKKEIGTSSPSKYMTEEVQSKLIKEYEANKNVKATPSKKIEAKNSSIKKTKVNVISLEEEAVDAPEPPKDFLTLKVEEKENQLQYEIEDIDNQTRLKIEEMENLLKGAGLGGLDLKDIESIDYRLNKFSNKAKAIQDKLDEDVDALIHSKNGIAKRIEELSHKRDGLISSQDDLKTYVSHKSIDQVDIKPGKTIEDIYVTLRQRPKILKAQDSKEVPILKPDQKVLLLPERSIRILKEFLVQLKDQENEELDKQKQENIQLKESREYLFTKIKEQYERDKVVGAPDENDVKKITKEYEEFFANIQPKWKSADEKLNEITLVYGNTLDKYCSLGKEQHKLYSKFIEIDREVKRRQHIVSDMRDKEDGIKDIHGERYRKKERAIEKQNQIIKELNELLANLTKRNQELSKLLLEKEIELQKLEDSFSFFGIKEKDLHIIEKLKAFMEANQERRQFQNESEEFPPHWDKLFKEFIEDSCSELKTSTNEYPSNKQFPGLANDWIDTINELNESDRDLKLTTRKQIAQDIKLEMLKDIQNEIKDIKSKFNEPLYADKIKDKRAKIKEQKLEIQALETDIKSQMLMSNEFKKLEDITFTDHKETDEWEEYIKKIDEVRNLKHTVGEAERSNENKANIIKNKDDYIQRLKEEIELKRSRPQNSEIEEEKEEKEEKDLDFLMAQYLESSAVPIIKLSSDGAYLFGTKKVFAKVFDNALYIRVGGGYMGIQEFLEKNTDIEIIRINKAMEREAVDKYEDLQVYLEYVVRAGLHDKKKTPFEIPIISIVDDEDE